MTTNPKGKRISVTRAAIADSKQRDSSHCMIAEAIKSNVPEARNVSVDIQTIRFSDPSTGLRSFYLTPHKAQQAIIDFDQGKEVTPFVFVLSKPHRVPMNISAPARANAKGVQTRPKRERKGGKSQRVVATDGNKGWPAYKIGRRREFGLRMLEP